MRILNDTFVLLHIKISHVSVFGFPARSFLTGTFILLLFFGCFNLFLSSVDSDVIGFAESLIYVTVIAYSLLFWLKASPKADLMLHKAGDMDMNKATDKKEKN